MGCLYLLQILVHIVVFVIWRQRFMIFFRLRNRICKCCAANLALADEGAYRLCSKECKNLEYTHTRFKVPMKRRTEVLFTWSRHIPARDIMTNGT